MSRESRDGPTARSRCRSPPTRDTATAARPGPRQPTPRRMMYTYCVSVLPFTRFRHLFFCLYKLYTLVYRRGRGARRRASRVPSPESSSDPAPRGAPPPVVDVVTPLVVVRHPYVLRRDGRVDVASSAVRRGRVSRGAGLRGCRPRPPLTRAHRSANVTRHEHSPGPSGRPD